MDLETFGLLIQIDDSLRLDIPEQDFSNCKALLFLGEDELSISDVDMDDIIGYSTSVLDKGEIFQNPFDTTSYLEVIEVESGRALVALRRV